MNVLVIEDEGLAARQIVNYLAEIDSNIQVAEVIDSVESGLEWFQTHASPQLIISDIKLTDGLSFEIFSVVKPSCPIIFTTAYDQYAIKAFEHNGVGYLLKPISKDQLKECLEKLNKQLSGVNIDVEKLAEMINGVKKVYKSRFLVKIGQKIKAIPVEKIAYFFSHDKLTFLMTHAHEKYPVDPTLEELESVLDPQYFFRLNRKFIAHFEGIKEIHPYFKGRVKILLSPELDEEIIISSEKTPAFKEWLDK